MSDPWWAMPISQFLIVAPVALFFAWALCASGAPGGRSGGHRWWGSRGMGWGGWGGGALGGLIAAVLLGPAVLGRVAPEFHTRVFTGGIAQQAELDQAAARTRANLAALRATGVSESAIDEATQDFHADLEPLRQAHADALDSNRQRSWWMIVALASLHASMGVMTMLPTSTRLWSVSGRTLWAMRARPVIAGALMLFLTAAPVALALALAPGLRNNALLAASLVFALPAFAASQRDDDAPMFLAALSAFIIGAIVFFALVPTIQMFTIAAFVCFGAMMSLGWPALTTRARKPVTALMATVTLPILIALAGVHIDPTRWSHSAPAWHVIVPMLIALLWASDGRWAALNTAARLLRLRTDRAWEQAARQVNAGSGSIELTLAITAFASGLFDDRVLAAALVGVAVIELTREIRVSVARMLDGNTNADEQID